MDFQLNTKNLPPPPPPPSSSSSASSTMKRSFHGRKLQYQEKVLEQSILPQQTAILSPTYLTADRAWKTVATIVAHKAGHDQKRQEMELKNIGKVVTANHHLFDVDPRRLSIISTANTTSTGVTIHQRRTSIVNYYQRRNSQLRKSSFTTSTLVCDKI
ncbi:unnamed protein product [Rotaria magnacalcarata]|uniref:Uncharacterized protein n=1 Tax=Rotaria magnacalcarata TaxID=392030 RepID=A0A816P8B1_9BILA|nr:unnamed protein product [Rotaria magnacalcarata]